MLIFQCRACHDVPVADKPCARPAPRQPQQQHHQQRSPRTPELHRSPPRGISRKRNCRSAAQPARAGRSDRPARLAHEDLARVRVTLPCGPSRLPKWRRFWRRWRSSNRIGPAALFDGAGSASRIFATRLAVDGGVGGIKRKPRRGDAGGSSVGGAQGGPHSVGSFSMLS